jgi:ribonuclease P protein component
MASAPVWPQLPAARSLTPAAPKAASVSLTSSLTVEVLRKRSDFLRVGANPKKASTKTIVVLAAPNELAKIRVGYTVTKKTSKLAVDRNRIKRRLRAIVQEIFPAHAVAGHDYVIIGKLDVLKRDYQDLKGDLKYALKKLGIS